MTEGSWMVLPWRLFPQLASQALLGPYPLKPISSLLHRQPYAKQKGKKNNNPETEHFFFSSLPIINFVKVFFALFNKAP